MKTSTKKNVSTVIPYEECVGCLACSAICPVSCLTPLRDKAGFYYVCGKDSSCVNCGKCLAVCPALHKKNAKPILKAAWAQATDYHVLKQSSSGGLFKLLADKILSDHGAIYGVSFDSALQAKHIRVTDQGSLTRLLGSKYVQSLLGPDIFSQVAEDLSSGRKVLFSGTPCQTETMANYLRTKRIPTEELISISIICHGVPSPQLWNDWIRYLEMKEDSPIRNVFFRDKTHGWKDYAVRYEFSSGTMRTIPSSSDWFMKAFLENASLRPSCFACPSKEASGSDIILGDFWGIETIHPEADTKSGVSAIVVLSEKGLHLLEAVQEVIRAGESSFEKITANNPALAKSVKPFNRYSDFMNQVKEGKDIPALMEAWDFKMSFKEKLKRKLRKAYRNLCST